MVESVTMPHTPPQRAGDIRDPMVGKILECVRDLLPLKNLDELLKAGVDLARSKLGVERCSLLLLDFEKASLRGTWGTDLEGNTTDEHSYHCSLVELEAHLPCKFQDMRV